MTAGPRRRTRRIAAAALAVSLGLSLSAAAATAAGDPIHDGGVEITLVIEEWDVPDATTRPPVQSASPPTATAPPSASSSATASEPHPASPTAGDQPPQAEDDLERTGSTAATVLFAAVALIFVAAGAALIRDARSAPRPRRA
ncbi:MAG: hypothetical protein LBD70_05990 [Bifidobacteriaceae bacterium]|jgi:hypothetical protein|nr:hypothetical protein [Bifidobacteriaceae bacterium]